MFTSNTISEPKEIKDKLITRAEVIYATTLDNRASIPVGVWYQPKSVWRGNATVYSEVCKDNTNMRTMFKTTECNKPHRVI